MTSSNVYFIICCVLALLATIIFTILSVVLYKKEQALKSPYYFCDSDWECCRDEDGCDANLGKDITKAAPATYKMAERFIPGSAYHQNCVLPIINGIKNYQGPGAHGFNFGYIYGVGSDPGNNPSPYYPGCSGPGSEAGPGDKPECSDPTLNPYNTISANVCPYSSTDAPLPSNPNFDPSYPNDVTKATLANGNALVSSSKTLNPQYWYTTTNTSAYVAGVLSSPTGPSGGYSANGYTCPYNIPNGGSSATSTVNNSQNNWLKPIPPP